MSTAPARLARFGRPGDGAVPPNLIPPRCQRITPEMLPLVRLDARQIEWIAGQTSGGAQNIQDIYPLTPLQEGILFHHMLGGQGDAYLLQELLELQSREQLDAFIGALQGVIERYDILRSAVLWEELPQPVQVVHRRAPLSVATLRLQQDRDPVEQLREWMREEWQRLDLRQAPLVRLQVAPAVASSRWYAVLQVHHIACDARSLGTLFAEVVAFMEGRPPVVHEPVQYRSHVAQTSA
jgi:syringomycin synthetase protein SyrE